MLFQVEEQRPADPWKLGERLEQTAPHGPREPALPTPGLQVETMNLC